jgi:hypothetical protein
VNSMLEYDLINVERVMQEELTSWQLRTSSWVGLFLH